MIVGSGAHYGPMFICDRCNWSTIDWCTCNGARWARRHGDAEDREWRAERRRTVRINRATGGKAAGRRRVHGATTPAA